MLLSVISVVFSAQIWHGPRDVSKVALTFDDGPRPEQADKILDILDQYGVRATFFVVGESMRLYPDLGYRIVTQGHELANHSDTHVRLDRLPVSGIRNEFQRSNRAIYRVTGRPVPYFRPPGGRINDRVIDVAERLGMQAVMWDVNAGDFTHAGDTMMIQGESSSKRQVYYQSAAAMTREVLAKIQPGSIVLFHNGGEQTIAALPGIIEAIKAKGLEMVVVSELMGRAWP